MGILNRQVLDMQHSYTQLGARNNLWYKDTPGNITQIQIIQILSCYFFVGSGLLVGTGESGAIALVDLDFKDSISCFN